jgi:hypothetical protein
MRDFRSGAQALIFQFTHATSLEDKSIAEKLARDFLKAYPKDDFANRMRLSLGNLLMNAGRLEEAKTEIDAVVRQNDGTLPEALLAQAQIKQLEAELVKADKDAYNKKLGEAREAYASIVSQVQAQREFWPEKVYLAAEFSLLLINDQLAGYQHPAPKLPAAPLSSAEAENMDVGVVAAPPSDDEGKTAESPAPAEEAEAAE